MHRSRANSDSWAVIDFISGEEVIPFERFSSFWASEEEGIIVANGPDGGRVINLASGEEMTPSWIDENERILDYLDNIAITTTLWISPSRSAFNIKQDEVVIPPGKYSSLSPRADGMMIAQDRRWSECGETECMENSCGQWWCGNYITVFILLDIKSGEEIFVGDVFHEIRDVYNGLAIISGREPLEISLIDVTNGDVIIPFGVYNNIRIFPNGFVALQSGRGNPLWQFQSIETIKSTYGNSK